MRKNGAVSPPSAGKLPRSRTRLKVRERKRAKEVLKESEIEYRRLVDNSLTGISITQNHLLKFCNQRFAEIFSYSRPEEMIGISLRYFASASTPNPTAKPSIDPRE